MKFHKIILLLALVFTCNFCYPQMAGFKIPLITYNMIDPFITSQKFFIYQTILDSISKEFENKIKLKTLVNIDLRYDKYESYVGYGGNFLLKDLNVEDSNCLMRIKNHYRKNISDSSLFITLKGKSFSIREVLISSSFFNSATKINKLYIEINAPAEGWDALYLNSLCKYLDNIRRSDSYTREYYFHQSEKIFIPVYLYNDDTINRKEFVRFYVFTYKEENNSIQIKFNGFISL